MSTAPQPGPEPQKAQPSATQPEVQPSEHDVIGALASVTDATRRSEGQVTSPVTSTTAEPPSFETSSAPIYVLFALLIALALIAATGIVIGGPKLMDMLVTAGKNINIAGNGSNSSGSRTSRQRGVNNSLQQQAEDALARAVRGDVAARDVILLHHREWTGQTTRTEKVTQLVDTGMNASDMEVRHATLLVQLAVDGVTVDARGFDWVQRNASSGQYRAWGLWEMGALGNLGVEPAQAGKILAGYVHDADPQIRAGAVNGLGILGHGRPESIPVLLDRFRNDTSPLVQENAARCLAVSGMFTHEDRMMAANEVMGWLDDPALTAAQRAWALHLLRDVSGKDFGSDSAAWRKWYSGAVGVQP